MPLQVDKNRVFEKIAEQHGLNRHEANQHGWNREQNQRQRDNPLRFVRFMMLVVVAMSVMRIMMSVRILVIALFAVEHQKIQPKGIKGRDKNASQHSEIRKSATP